MSRNVRTESGRTDLEGLRRGVRLTVLPLLFGLAGCGDEATGPRTGQAEAFVGDAPGGSPTFTGTAAGDFQASVSVDGSTWVDLGSPNGITVVLQSAGIGTTVHGAQAVPAGTYRWARLVLRDIEIILEAGSRVDGTVLDADAKIDLAAEEPLFVEREVDPVTVTSDSGIRILFDLDAEAWLTDEAVTTGTVPGSQVAAAMTAAASR